MKKILISGIFAAMLFFLPAASVAAGSSYGSETAGGIKINYVNVNLSDGNIRPVLLNAKGQMNAADSLENMAVSAQAFAAVNGTYFSSYSGTPVSWGTMIRDGKVLHISQSGAVCGITSSGKLLIDRLTFSFEGYINGVYRAIPWRINHPSPESGAITIFTPEYGTEVEVTAGARGVLVKDGSVVQIAESDFVVPANGFAIVYNPAVAYLVEERYQIGDAVEYRVKVHTTFTDPEEWEDTVVGMGAGPSLIVNGTVTAQGEAEGFTEAKINTHAAGRSFLGAKSDGTIVIGTLSAATLTQAAKICQDLGLVNAMCLDGGDSSALYYPSAGISKHGRLINNGLGFVDLTKVYAPAKPAALSILADGRTTRLSVYNIGGSNYFKLRDFAMILAGSEKEFNLSWDEAIHAIRIFPEQPYAAVGGELGILWETITAKAYSSSAKVFLEDEVLPLTTYNINGSNYFSLRDLGRAFDIGVRWDAEENAVRIDTDTGYTEE